MTTIVFRRMWEINFEFSDDLDRLLAPVGALFRSENPETLTEIKGKFMNLKGIL